MQLAAAVRRLLRSGGLGLGSSIARLLQSPAIFCGGSVASAHGCPLRRRQGWRVGLLHGAGAGVAADFQSWLKPPNWKFIDKPSDTKPASYSTAACSRLLVALPDAGGEVVWLLPQVEDGRSTYYSDRVFKSDFAFEGRTCRAKLDTPGLIADDAVRRYSTPRLKGLD